MVKLVLLGLQLVSYVLFDITYIVNKFYFKAVLDCLNKHTHFFLPSVALGS